LIEVREASLDDVEDITEVHKSDVKKWYRVVGSELIEADYDELTVEERWLHGGQWMSIETCYLHIKSFLEAGGRILVAETDNRIVGEIEFITDREPSPYLDHAEIYVLMVHRDYRDRGIGGKLMQSVEPYCDEMGFSRILLSSEERSIKFYYKIGYELFEEHETILVDLRKLPKIKVNYEPLTRITSDDVADKLLIIGRFHNTIATLYNIKDIFPFERMIMKYFHFKIIDKDKEHVLVIRKSNMINNSMYYWLDSRIEGKKEILHALFKALYLARKLGISKILVGLRKDLIDLLDNELNYKSIEKIPWFIKEVC